MTVILGDAVTQTLVSRRMFSRNPQGVSEDVREIENFLSAETCSLSILD
jgi:hypothetical protein